MFILMDFAFIMVWNTKKTIEQSIESKFGKLCSVEMLNKSNFINNDIIL